MLSWAKFLFDVEVGPSLAGGLAREISSLDEALVRVHAAEGLTTFLENFDTRRVGVWLLGGPAAIRAALDAKPGWRPEVCSIVADGTDANLPELENTPSSLAFEIDSLFSISRDGRAIKADRRSEHPVWEHGIATALAEVGVDITTLHTTIRIPWVMTAKGPAGARGEHWVLGGSQAAGVMFSQVAGRIAFGFEDAGEFEQWVQWAGDLESDDVRFRTGFGEKRGPGPTRDRQPALQLAYEIVEGYQDSARSTVGIGVLPIGKTPSGHAHDGQLLLARAIGIIALCRHPMEKRKAAARLLALVGHRQAERIGRFLIKADATLLEMKVFGQGRARKRRHQATNDPIAAMKFVGEVLDALLAIFTKETAR